MKKLRAINTLYMALPQDNNFTYEYSQEIEKFYMITDKERFYEVESMINNYEWLIFETELMSNGKGIIHGEVKQIKNDELKEYIKDISDYNT